MSMAAPQPILTTPCFSTQTPEAASAQHIWDELADFANEWFHKPDLEAFRISVVPISGHYYLDADPVWMFLIGPPGCGKTSLGINSHLSLPNVYVMGDLTERTLISGFKKGGTGLLHAIGDSGILLFKDFTTILSKRPDSKAEIVAQLREVYDGMFQRMTGTQYSVAPWKGKITVLAAVTPVIEQHWGLMRELGERFMAVRWPRGKGVDVAKFALRQRGKEKHITRTMQDLIVRLISPSTLQTPPVLPEQYVNTCVNMAEAVAIMRGIVPRHGGHEISGSPMIEAPTRLSKSLGYLVTANAAMMRRQVIPEDFQLARRCALDTMPSNRRKLLEHIPLRQPVGTAKLLTDTGMPATSATRHAEELESLGVLKIEHNTVENQYSIAPEFAGVLESAGLFGHQVYH